MTFIGKLVASLAYRYLAWATPLPKGVSNASPSQTPRINFPLLVYSHRGGDREVDPSCGLRYVENTLPAFRNSVAVGADLLELDVQLSADGAVVVCHDSHDLARLCGPGPPPPPPAGPGRSSATSAGAGASASAGASAGAASGGAGGAASGRAAGSSGQAGRRGRVADYAVSDLPPLLRHPPLEATGTGPGPAAAAQTPAAAAAAAGSGPAGAGTGPTAAATATATATAAVSDPDATRMPLLEEVLRQFPHTPLQVDVKVASPQLVAAVTELLARYRPLPGAHANSSVDTDTTGGDGVSSGAEGKLKAQPAAAAHAACPNGQSPAGGAAAAAAVAAAAAHPEAGSAAPAPGPASCSSYAGSGVLWGSFHHATCCQLHAADPARPLFCSLPRALLLLAAHLTGRLHEVAIYESAIILPWRLPRAPNWLGRVVAGLIRVATAQEADAAAAAAAAAATAGGQPAAGGIKGGGGDTAGASLLLPDFFRALQARGVSVVLFADVNTESDFAACLGAGADALCTDSPARLRAWLRGQQKQQQQQQQQQHHQ